MKGGGHLVLFPCPLQGHINPMLQLATILHSNGFSITIIHTQFNSPNPSNYPNFSFQPIPDGLTEEQACTKDFIAQISVINVNCRLPFRDRLAQLVSNMPLDTITCIISDAIMHFTQGVADELKLPRIIIRTSSSISFVPFAYFPLLRNKGYIPIQDHLLEMPVMELPPLRVKDLPDVPTSDPDTLHHLVANMVKEAKASRGIIWNTIEEIEAPALTRIQQEMSVPVFPIGPLHKYSPSSFNSLLTQDQSCLAWLDKQADGSVLYVSFGSLAAMNEVELEETAWGLANSEQPFLWVVRPGSVHGMEWVQFPQGFEEKTEGRGCIVKWAPQEKVLAHPAVGGFWTHNGWNSTLESICEEVPMICSPCFGDQRVNARYVSHVWKIGVQIEKGLERVEIEMAIKRLMVGKEAKEIRKRIKALKEQADHCLKEGGSSHESLERLTNFILSL